jgi:hypothetical protein
VDVAETFCLGACSAGSSGRLVVGDARRLGRRLGLVGLIVGSSSAPRRPAQRSGGPFLAHVGGLGLGPRHALGLALRDQLVVGLLIDLAGLDLDLAAPWASARAPRRLATSRVGGLLLRRQPRLLLRTQAAFAFDRAIRSDLPSAISASNVS